MLVKININLNSRKTSVTIHETLKQMASVALYGTLDSSISAWLSKRLSNRLGIVPIRESKNSNTSWYAVDELLNLIAQPDLVIKYNALIQG